MNESSVLLFIGLDEFETGSVGNRKRSWTIIKLYAPRQKILKTQRNPSHVFVPYTLKNRSSLKILVQSCKFYLSFRF